MISIIVTKGITSSGKTTWARSFAKNNAGWIVLSTSDIAYSLKCNISKKEKTNLRNLLLREALSKNYNVIVDEQNLNSSLFYEIVSIVDSMHIDCVVEEKIFYCDLRTALSRNKRRHKPFHKQDIIVTNQYCYTNGANLLCISPNKFISKKHFVNECEDRQHAVICNVEDILALSNLLIDNNKKPIYKKAPFKERLDASDIENYLINEVVFNILKRHEENGCKILFFTKHVDFIKKVNGFIDNLGFKNYKLIPYAIKSNFYHHLLDDEKAVKTNNIFKELAFLKLANEYYIKLVIDHSSSDCYLWSSLFKNRVVLKMFGEM